jgi:hypothetical protein
VRRSRTIVAHGVQWKLPVFIVLAAIGILGVGLWLTNATPGSAEFAAREMARPTSGIQSAVADLADLEPGAKMLVGAFAAQPSFSSAGNGQPELIPEEWEAPLFDILLDEKQDMNQRNARLLELATGAAKGVPSVQEECLMHLLFGLADDDGARFLAVATNEADRTWRVAKPANHQPLRTRGKQRCPAVSFGPQRRLSRIFRVAQAEAF